MILKNDIPPGRSPIGNKWIFKEKRNGQFRARLVALGYSQVPGIDFLNNYLPVVNDTSFRILLVLIKKNNLDAWSLDVETAFLNGELEEEIFMKIPEGLYNQEGNETSSNSVLRLKKSIYGLLQAARQWFLKFEEALKNIGFRNNQIDPCLFIKKEDSKFCAVCVYVDDCILTGDQATMEEVIEGLKRCLPLKFKKISMIFWVATSSWESMR